MSLILCRKKADSPFIHSKLNIGIWTEQELCFCLYNYPLLCLNDFVDEKLFDWIEKELQLNKLASELRQRQRMGETVENQMLFILQECNYYDVNEVVEFSGRMVELRKRSEAELVYMEGELLYKAEKYSLAYDKFAEAVRKLDQQMKKEQEEEVLSKLAERKASMFCDMAVIKLRMFDENKAIELLISSELTYYNKRAVRMRYLVNGTGELGDNEKQELDELKQKAVETARESSNYKDICSLFEKDSIRITKDARVIISRWKNNYRKM